METYQVVVVRYPAWARPRSWRKMPEESVELGVLRAGLCLPVAKSFARAFNLAEFQRPYGVWAIVRADP